MTRYAFEPFAPRRGEEHSLPAHRPGDESDPFDAAGNDPGGDDAGGDPDGAPSPARAYASVPGVYSGAARLVASSQVGGKGGSPVNSVKLKLLDANPADPHPCRTLRWSQKAGEGQRLRVVMFLADDAGEIYSARGPLYDGDASLAWWAEDCVTGMHFKVVLDSGPDAVGKPHPLINLKCGLKDGDILSVSCWVLGDDELPEPPPPPRKPSVPFRSMDATRQAAVKCGDHGFRAWCRDQAPDILGADAAEALPPFDEGEGAFAAEVVRLYCRVASRAHLREKGPEGEAARARWGRLLSGYMSRDALGGE